jgi:hypothetical protein
MSYYYKKTAKPPAQHLMCSDLVIRGFWICRTDAIVNVQVMDTAAKSYRSLDPHKVLAQQEYEKKKKYLTNNCLEPIGCEAAELLKRFRLLKNWYLFSFLTEKSGWTFSYHIMHTYRHWQPCYFYPCSSK